MRKFEIAKSLGQRYGYSTYLEICTATTGGAFADVDSQQFPRRVRAMYNCTRGFSDGAPIDLSTAEPMGDQLFAKLMRSGEKFDLVFVDSFHSYEASLNDLVYGLQLVKEDGIVLVHDCFPANKSMTWPEFIPGLWAGLSYAAFLDVVLFSPGLQYFTIDADFGCGVISKDARLAPLANGPIKNQLLHQWRMLDLGEKYPFFETHHRQLLNLVTPEAFREFLSSAPPAEFSHPRTDDLSPGRSVLTKIADEKPLITPAVRLRTWQLKISYAIRELMLRRRAR